MSTLSTQATTAAILAAGLSTRLSRALHASGLPLVPQGPPGPDEAGFPCSGSKAVDVRVSLHRDARTRSVFLQIDRDSAPLTGNYIVEIDGTTSTYNATSEAPGDVDELLAEWAAKIAADLTAEDIVAVASSLSGSGDADGILISGPTDAGEYATYAIGADTAAPEAAALVVWREPDTASLRIWTRSGMQIDPAQVWGWQSVSALGWVVAGDLGEIPGGYDDRLDLAARTAIWPELYGLDADDEAISVVTSGAGVYGLEWLAVVAVAPAVTP